MNQTGDQVQLMVAPIPSGSAIYSYVWDFWDGSSTATSTAFVAKVVNIGGQPGTDELHYTCRPVATDGQSVTLNGTLTANNPPTILPGVSISNNDGYFAYATSLALTALDMDDDDITFAWYAGGTFLGVGTSSYVGYLDGTWTGNGTTMVQGYRGTHNYLDLIVASPRVVTCYVADDRGGTSSVSFGLRGDPNPPPDATVTAGVPGVSWDSTTPATARIGIGKYIDFTVYVAPMPQHSISFLWTFSGSEGWTMPPVFDYGTITVMDNGGLQNTTRRDIATEVITSGTSKLVTAQMRVSAINIYNGELSHSDQQFDVLLLANNPPSAVTVTRTTAGGPVSGVGPVPVGTAIEFAADGTDADLDLLWYKWRFVRAFTPNTLYLWGPKVVYDTGSYTAPNTILGDLTVTDRMGDSITVLLPTTNLS